MIKQLYCELDGILSEIINKLPNKKYDTFSTSMSLPTHIVVFETRRQSYEILKECNRYSIAVTYNLVIAKTVPLIQYEEKSL